MIQMPSKKVGKINNCREFKMEITKKYLQKEIFKFREIMGNRIYSVEDVAKALEGLLFVYSRFQPENEKDKEQMGISMESLTKEYDMRLGYRLALGI